MTPQQQAIVIRQSAQGIPGSTIAQSLNVHPATVTRTQQRPDLKARIQAIRERVINEAAETAGDNLIFAVRSYQSKGIRKDPQLREHGHKVSIRMAEAIGILPAHAPSIYIQQIFEGGQVSVNTEVMTLLSQIMGSDAAQAVAGLGDVIDVGNPVDNPVVNHIDVESDKTE